MNDLYFLIIFCILLDQASAAGHSALVSVKVAEAQTEQTDQDKTALLDRLSCLQSDQSSAGKWKQETIFGKHDSQSKHWTFQPDNCPLKPFDVDAFCRIALRCQNMLMVGDSTVESLYHAGSSLLSGKHNENEHVAGPPEIMLSEDTHSAPCPNKYDHLATSRRPRRQRLMYGRHVCNVKSACPAPLQVTLSFVKHEMLVGHIGLHSADRQCDYWQEILDKYPLQYYSFGAHIPQIVESYTHKGAAKNMTKVFHNHAAAFASVLARNVEERKKRKEKKTAHIDSMLEHLKRPLIIYETARWGSLDYTEECATTPFVQTQQPNTSHGILVNTTLNHKKEPISLAPFHWSSIPAVNSAMLEELKAAIPEGILLTLKTANMVSQRQGCRVDFLHYTHPKFSFSPDWRTWQLLWNLLQTESQTSLTLTNF